MILESSRTGIPIITPYDSRYIVQEAREMGVKIHQPMTINEYKYFRGNGSLINNKNWKGKLLIDEVDTVLHQLLEADIEKVTCTQDYENERGKRNMDRNEFWVNYEAIKRKNPDPVITDIDIIVPDKVVDVTFADGLKEKMILHKGDKFDLQRCLFIAIAKHLYKKDYTHEGIEWKALELTYLKKYVRIVDVALKAFYKKEEDVAKREENYKAELERFEKKRAKRQAYKERRAAKRVQEEMEKQIAIQKEAYIQAMEYLNGKN